MELFGIGFVIALVVIGLLVYMIVRLTAQRDVERTKAENYARQMNEMKDAHALQLKQAKDDWMILLINCSRPRKPMSNRLLP